MVIIKYCCYRGCRNNSRNLDPSVVQGATFYPFPKPKTKLEKCKKWLIAIGREDLNNVDQIKGHHYICNYHFEDGQGPTDRNPDPFPYGRIVNEARTISPGLLGHESIQGMGVQEVHQAEVTELVIPDNNKTRNSESSTNITHIQRKLGNLNDVMLKFLLYQVQNLEKQLMWGVVKNYDSLVFNKATSYGKIVSVCVKMNSIFEVKVEALGNLIRETNDIWKSEKSYKIINNFEELLTFLTFLDSCSLCGGIPDKELIDLEKGNKGSQNSFTNSLHSTECEFIYVAKGISSRCKKCNGLRRILSKRFKRKNVVVETRTIKRCKSITNE